jgi:hypothetical protein
MRMNQLQQVQTQLPPELVQQIQGLPTADPAAAWRAVSGAFTQQAAGAGYQIQAVPGLAASEPADGGTRAGTPSMVPSGIDPAAVAAETESKVY